MLSFRSFLLEGIRQGLPHITTMDHEQFTNLIHGGHVGLPEVTEKTDGMTHVFGHDEHGFYTQSSGSGNERMRKPEDFIERAKRRAEETGKPLDLTAANAFAHVHRLLQSNEALQDHLKRKAQESGGETKVRGEVFYKPLSRPSEEHPGQIKFVGTSYDPSHMGSVGKYVIHTKLPENQDHDADHFARHFSTPEMNFDSDKVEHEPSHVDVSDEHKEFHKLDHDLLKSRTTPSNKAAKMAEMEKFDIIKKSVSDKVDAHVKKKGYTPKWGSGSEGLVVHPAKGSPAPRFKITSPGFREYKASDASKNFKKRMG